MNILRSLSQGRETLTPRLNKLLSCLEGDPLTTLYRDDPCVSLKHILIFYFTPSFSTHSVYRFRLHSLCILQGGGGEVRRTFFKGANVFNHPLAQKKNMTPHPVLTRKVKYRQYDKMVERLMCKIEK